MSKTDEEKQAQKIADAIGHRARVRAAVDRNPNFEGWEDYELLEYLLQSTIARKDTKGIAKELIRIFGSLSGVLHADFYEIVRVDGVGEKTAHLLAHMLPIVIRGEYSRFDFSHKVDTPAHAARYLFARFLGDTSEKLLMVSANINEDAIQTDEIAHGSVDATQVDIMKLLRTADRNGAKEILLAHNHPGGTMAFSKEDIQTTARIVSCCMQTGFGFLDHLIFFGNKYLSMFGNGAIGEMLELCEHQTRQLTYALAQERTARSIRYRLHEKESEAEYAAKQLQILDAYRTILSWKDSERNAVCRNMLFDIADAFKEEEA